mgnify:CR=1 FL=1
MPFSNWQVNYLWKPSNPQNPAQACFPNGIISQGGEAAKDAYFANGTIGMAVAEKTPIELDSYKKIMPDLNPRETVAYEKTAGNPELRKIWKDKL